VNQPPGRALPASAAVRIDPFHTAGLVAANRHAVMAGLSQPKTSPSSTTRSRSFTSMPGRSILGGQTSRQAPHRVQAYGSCSLPSNPNRTGESTEPIGPG